jgi:hypothetical protein
LVGGQDVPVGGLRSATSSVLVYFVPNGTDSNGRLEIRFQTGGSPPAPVNLGAVKVNGWQCVELVHDGTNVTSYVGLAMTASTPVAVSFDTVEVGFDWPYTGNTNAAKAFAYDNVVIAPDRIGCLTNQ